MSTTSKFDSEKLDFHACFPASSEKDLDPQLVDFVRSAQRLAGFTFTITSALRSVEHEKKRGRTGSSSHCKGLAVDISARDSHERFLILASLLFVGVPRLGIGKTFIHADIDLSKAHPIIFHYYD